MKKYYANTAMQTIEHVEISAETKTMITKLNGMREKKQASWQGYFDTWMDAWTFLLNAATTEVNAAKRSLEYRMGKLGNVKGLKPPAGAE